MHLRDHGIGRRELRQGSGVGDGNDHFDELVGSTEFYIYQTPNRKYKGYEALRLYLESQGCEVAQTRDAPPELGQRYETLRITQRRGEAIPVAVLRRSHAWAHRQNFLHQFYKPLFR